MSESPKPAVATENPETIAEAAAQRPATTPEPGIDPAPPGEPIGDPRPDPQPTPDTPDPEPDRDPNPGPPPAGPDAEPTEPPRIEPPTNPDEEPVKAEGQTEKGTEGQGPELVLTHPEPKASPKTAAKDTGKQSGKPKSAEEQQYSPFDVTVGKVYDGPLDLLLDLIRKQDIDIYDIPIATITAQFLGYVNQLKASDVDVAGEFIYTASLLIHIKSKMLLPREKTGPDEMGEDPRRELVERLLEHERFKNAAQMLQQKQILEAASWTNPGMREFRDDVAAEPEIAADTTDLVRIFQEILERARKRPVFNVQDDSVTVGQMIEFLGRRLTMEDKPIALKKLLAHSRSERALVAMFLALLELVRLQAVLLRQDREFSEIFIKKSGQFETVLSDSLAVRDDWK
jgi:segregation and condensation protein A